VTRTQKVRRPIVAERYASLINALYDGSHAADIVTEVTFEDGRKGVLSARINIRDVEAALPSEGSVHAAPSRAAAERAA